MTAKTAIKTAYSLQDIETIMKLMQTYEIETLEVGEVKMSRTFRSAPIKEEPKAKDPYEEFMQKDVDGQDQFIHSELRTR